MHVCMQAYFWSKFIQREKDASKSQKPGVGFFCEVRSTCSHDQELFFLNQTINQFFKLWYII